MNLSGFLGEGKYEERSGDTFTFSQKIDDQAHVYSSCNTPVVSEDISIAA
jgi:hypothetical protein